MEISPKNKLKEIMNKDDFIKVNRKIIGLIGLNNSVLLTYLLFKDNLSNGDFFVTRQKITKDTGLKQWVQKSSLAFLQDNNLISVYKKGIPPKNWFMINYKNIIKIMIAEREKPVEEKIDKHEDEQINSVVVLFKDSLNIKDIRNKTIHVVKDIFDYYFKIPRDDKQGRPIQLLNFLIGREGDPKKFCKKYINWFRSKYGSKNSFVKISDIGPRSNTWELFIKQTLQEIGAEIRTKRDGEKYMWVISI